MSKSSSVFPVSPIPPGAIEVEMALLGAMILDPDVIGDVIQVVKSPDRFYLLAHQRIFEVLIDLFNRHRANDLIQLVDALDDDEAVRRVGGAPYLERLASDTPGPGGALRWARIVGNAI